MLAKLKINNFIIVESVEIDFSVGLNAIVGETGAGKSIIMEALMLLFGAKAMVDYIRNGTNKAIIEGSFFFTEAHSFLFEYLKSADVDCDSNEIIIRREISNKGSARCFINDTPVTLSFLKYFSRNIVDFHGQNEQQKILEKDYQRTLIDNMLPTKTFLFNYKKSYNQYEDIAKQYSTIIKQRDNSAERQEILIKLLDEINEINPSNSEDIQIDKELKLFENAEFLVSKTENFIYLLDSNTDSMLWKLNDAKRQLNDLAQLDNSFSDYQKEFETAIISINETLNFVRNYQNEIEFNPAKIEQLRVRYAQLKKLNKKYGSLENALNKKIEFEKELNQIQNFDSIIADLEAKIQDISSQTKEIATKLSNNRKQVAKEFEKKIMSELAMLGLENVRLEVKFSLEKKEMNTAYKNYDLCIVLDDELVKINETGFDQIEFFISTNKGETLASIDAVASGGEISRTMLAIKTIMADNDATPILIFDEIDTGISGRIAQKVGIAIKHLSVYHQVLAITHLPQIAAMGNNFILVEKKDNNERSVTSARSLNEEEKVIEIAKLLSGENISDAAIEGAKELMI